MRILVLGLILALVPSPAHAQFKEQPQEQGALLGKESTVRIRVGAVIKAGGSLNRVVATIPVPGEWPEQQVRVANEDVTADAHVSYRMVGGGARQMVIEIPQLAAGREVKALVTFEVTRRAIEAPKNTEIYRIPKKLDRQLTMSVGSSPFIESKHRKIIAAAKEAVAGVESDWQKVSAIYDWVRDHVQYKQGDLKGAARALIDKEGDVDELTSLFIAMCRSQKIPARTVFVPGHCYAEFYLEDDQGKGHWFPCQPAGMASFGGINEGRPIMQKGDNYKNPENPSERLRWLREYFTAAGRGNAPKVKFVSEIVAE